jgi:hypothetical protein
MRSNLAQSVHTGTQRQCEREREIERESQTDTHWEREREVVDGDGPGWQCSEVVDGVWPGSRVRRQRAGQWQPAATGATGQQDGCHSHAGSHGTGVYTAADKCEEAGGNSSARGTSAIEVAHGPARLSCGGWTHGPMGRALCYMAHFNARWGCYTAPAANSTKRLLKRVGSST